MAAHFARVRTDDGYHLRLVAANGETVLWSENHPDKRDALKGIEVIAEAFGLEAGRYRLTGGLEGAHLIFELENGEVSYGSTTVQDIDERTGGEQE